MAKKKLKNKGKTVAKTATAIIDNISSEVIAAAAYSVASQPAIPVFLKVCRLCESKDGPFLNIFDADKVTAKKIDELMPFSITENDDLPHKICFRCSAKLEELYEFIQKCIKTQESLRKVIGNNSPFTTKSKTTKKIWEEKLNKTNMSNDDICDALIKKAMESIKAIPPSTMPLEEETPTETKRVTRSKETATTKKEIKGEPKSDDTDDMSLGQMKMSLDNYDIKPSTRSSRSDPQTKKAEASQPKKPVTPQSKKAEVTQTKKSEVTQTKKAEVTQTRKSDARSKKEEVLKSGSSSDSESKPTATTGQASKNSSINNFSFDYETPANLAPKTSETKDENEDDEDKPFDIFDYVSMIKVNGVGVLFQCKLCNRNFLKKEVVESHSCAKNGAPKVNIPKTVPAPEPPKVPSVKYIKIDGDMKKSLTEKVKAQKIENERLAAESNTTQYNNNEPPPLQPIAKKSKPKAGPASKTRRNVVDPDPSPAQTPAEPPVSIAPPPSIPTPASSAPPALPPAPVVPSVHFPTLPNLNGRFKLVPGPNNIFTLVEDVATAAPSNSVAPTQDESSPKKSSRKRKTDEVVDLEAKPKERKSAQNKPVSPEVIDLDDQSQPYPVGLFQTVPHAARLYEPPPVSAAPAPFTTPAMKKQSYTIVQTGNPSKLLISTKAKAVEEEVPKKRPRKSKHEPREEATKEPFTVTLEDVAPPKDSGFFTFINVDPLLQPSYVLPTDNIIQESQISTSSSVLRNPAESKEGKDKDKYSCNLCGQSFSREKKLLTHIQSHYKQMDEEDQVREEPKTNKKKGKK